jgi:hypothetical protein
MTNYLARYSDTEKKTVMICDDERDLFQLFGKSHQIGIQCNSSWFWQGFIDNI